MISAGSALHTDSQRLTPARLKQIRDAGTSYPGLVACKTSYLCVTPSIELKRYGLIDRAPNPVIPEIETRARL
jgi:hypothetical protein